jgi:DNA mismatch endonuclease, patch repair protein
MDRLTPKERSKNMSRVHSKDTRPEQKVRSLLHSLGFRFRLHRRDLPGTPDIVLVGRRAVILVNGCFWHQHKGCKDSGIPKSNSEFWVTKLNKNVERDKKNTAELNQLGWKVIEIWECETTDILKLSDRLLSQLLR